MVHCGCPLKFFYNVGSEVAGDLIRFGPELEQYINQFRKLYNDLAGSIELGRVPPNGFLRALAIRVFNIRASKSVEPIRADSPLGPVTYRKPLVFDNRPYQDNVLEDFRKACAELPINKTFGLSYEDLVTMPINEARDIIAMAKKVRDAEAAQMREAQRAIREQQTKNQPEK